MTTRDGRKWVVVYDSRGSYVARRDSPAAREAVRRKAIVARFRTLRGACIRRQQWDEG